jgi:RNA polymerase sigma-70 factor (ECF subfamily)
MSYKEIANEYNVSTKTVDYRIQQALKILRKQLSDYLPIEIVALIMKFMWNLS